MNISDLTNLKHVIYFQDVNENYMTTLYSHNLADMICKYINPILVTMGYKPVSDSNGNTQLEKYVYNNNEFIKVDDDERIKDLDSENLLEAVFYLLQEVSEQRNEIEELKKLTNTPCRY